MDRRNFLRSLFVASIATAMPGLPKSRVDAIAERATAAVHVAANDQEAIIFDSVSPLPDTVPLDMRTTVRDVGGGIYECTVEATSDRQGGYVSMSIRSNDPDGLLVGEEKYLREYLGKHPDRIAAKTVSVGGTSRIVFWMKA